MSVYRSFVPLGLMVAFLSAPLHGEDVFYDVSLDRLKIIEGEFPEYDQTRPLGIRWNYARNLLPYAVLDGPGEAFVQAGGGTPPRKEQSRIRIRSESSEQVTGRLYWPNKNVDGLMVLKFKVVSEPSRTHRQNFYNARISHYERLERQAIPGAAWFRYQANLSRRAVGRAGSTSNANRRFFGRRSSDLQDTYSLLSGGRALSENLQLDRVLPTTETRPDTVDLDSIEGITVREYEWEKAIRDLAPEKDRLADCVPDDQHVMFFPNFQAMVDLADNADEQSAPILNLAEPRAESAQTRDRYERQMGISLNAGARFFGPRLIHSVALTGSDPYFRTGTDVALLFHAKDADALLELLKTQVWLAAQKEGAKQQKGELGGVDYTSYATPDRQVSSFVASWDDVVCVSNSRVQLKRLIDVAHGRSPSIAELDEYTFFRDRYRLGDEEETSLLLISDATIRRWCGPRWRIGTSRRTRAVAVMTNIQATNMDRLVNDKITTGPIYGDAITWTAGNLELTQNGVVSDTYGTLDFQTPIIELDLDQVSSEEANLYGRWRDGYQRAWTNFFDPIAIRFHASEKTISADMTVMPLISGSRYREFIDITAGDKIAADAGDPHSDALLHVAAAVNRKSSLIRQQTNLLQSMAPQLRVDPLSWVGETIAAYVEDDPVWKELAESDDQEDFVESHLSRFPMGVYVEVTNGFKLTAFLTGLRAFIEQTAPGMTTWEIRDHGEQKYVRVGGTGNSEIDKLALFYVATSDSLILSLNEDLIKRSIDRIVAKREAIVENKPWESGSPPWLGDNLCFQVDHRVLEFFELAFRDNYQQSMQRLAWSNLPVLNEWKLRYPDRDPRKVHQEFWQRTLRCPGSGSYVWNEAYQTMESTVYGHPGEPKTGPSFPATLREISKGNFGLTFEPDGLRARVSIDRGEQ